LVQIWTQERQKPTKRGIGVRSLGIAAGLHQGEGTADRGVEDLQLFVYCLPLSTQRLGKVAQTPGVETSLLIRGVLAQHAPVGHQRMHPLRHTEELIIELHRMFPFVLDVVRIAFWAIKRDAFWWRLLTDTLWDMPLVGG
jgi:hypothetical protein